jgi:hypothetical protein
MAKGTDVAMEEMHSVHGGIVNCRRPLQRGSHVNLVSNGSMPGHRGFYEGWPAKWYVPDIDSDRSGMAIERALSSEFGQVTMNGICSGRMKWGDITIR